MKIIKKFVGALIVGAGCYAGTYLAKGGIEIAKDPYKRTIFKQKIKSIKDIIIKKEE